MWADTRKLSLLLRRCGANESYKGNHFQEQQPGAQQAVAGLFARTKALKNLSPTSLARASGIRHDKRQRVGNLPAGHSSSYQTTDDRQPFDQPQVCSAEQVANPGRPTFMAAYSPEAISRASIILS
jgi:hypothetical protein